MTQAALGRDDILRGLHRLDEISRDAAKVVDIAIYEGAALALGLRIYMPSPEYLFAMKCMAMRAEGLEGSHDISDIETLADIAHIADAATALELVESFYPNREIPPKVRFGLEEIMQRVQRRRSTGGRKKPAKP